MGKIVKVFEKYEWLLLDEDCDVVRNTGYEEYLEATNKA